MIGGLVSKRTKGRLRPLNPARDLGQLADLIEEAFGQELSDGGEQVLREIRLLSNFGPLNLFLTGMSSEVDGIFTGFVWDHDGRVVGNVTVNRPTGHPRRWQISNVAVRRAQQGQGIGRRLVEAAIDLVLGRGGRSVYLYVRDNNPPALHLYRSMGFVQVDHATDLVLDSPRAFLPSPNPHFLRPLKPEEGELLFELVSRAAAPGYRWLYAIHKSQYARPWDERILRKIGSFFSAETETQWGAGSGSQLHSGVVLRATRLWNRKPHRLRLWVHPSQRGQVEPDLARDIVSLLSQQSPRSARVSLPACEDTAVDALVACGFRKVRTLILMKLEL